MLLSLGAQPVYETTRRTSTNDDQMGNVSVLIFCENIFLIWGMNQVHSDSCFFPGQCFEPRPTCMRKAFLSKTECHTSQNPREKFCRGALFILILVCNQFLHDRFEDCEWFILKKLDYVWNLSRIDIMANQESTYRLTSRTTRCPESWRFRDFPRSNTQRLSPRISDE